MVSVATPPNITVRAAAEGLPEINRRLALMGGMSAAALAATSAAVRRASAATISAAPAEHPDAELFRLDRQMEEVHVQIDKIGRALRRIDSKLEKASPPRPLHPERWERPSMPDDLVDLERSALEHVTFADVRDGKDWTPAPVVAWEKAVDRERELVKAEWDQYCERRAEQRRLLNYDAKEAEHSEACDAQWEIGRRIFAIPADTLQGMEVKLRAGDRLCLEDFADENEAFLSIAADIRRLAAGGVS